MNFSDERKHARQHKMLGIGNHLIAAVNFRIIVTQKHQLPDPGFAIKLLVAKSYSRFCPRCIVGPYRVGIIIRLENIGVESAAVVVTEYDSFSYDFVVEYNEDCVVLMRIIQ